MDRHDPLAQVLVAPILEPHLADHLQQGLLVVELLDGLHEVLVGFTIAGDYLAHEGDDVEGVELVGLGEGPPGHFGELEAGEFTSSF